MKKKILVTLIAALTVCAAGLTSCGGGDGSSSAGENTASQSAASNDKDVSAVADELSTGIKYVDSLSELGDNMVENILGIKAELYTKCKVYVGSGGMTAEEIACFEAKDEASAGEIRKALETRISNQKESFKDYQPAEMPKLNDPVLIVSGNKVFMCISDDNAKAREIIG